MSTSATTPVTATPISTVNHPRWWRFSAVAAVAAPVCYALSAAFGVEHTDNTGRQLDIIATHVGNFTAMIFLERLCWLLAAVTAVAVAMRLSTGRGSRIAAAAAVLTVIGAAASLGDFGGALPTLARQDDREAAIHFLDHLGPIYTTTLGLSGLLQLGLILMLVALWRSRRVAWPYLAVSAVALVGNAFTGDGRVVNVVAMLVVAGGFVGIARFLANDDS